MDIRGFTHFAWINPSRAGHGFVASYEDKDGNHQFLSNGEDSRGNTLFRRFKFKPSKRMISVPNTQVDVIEFLRNHPDCKGSPNGNYAYDEHGNPMQIGYVFKEINEGKDAKLAIDATKLRTKALNHALELEDSSRADELKEVSVMTGYYNSDPGLQHFHILNYAENQPERYLDIINDPTRRAKYIIKNGLDGENKVLKKKGFMIYWEKEHLGNNFDEAVQKILSDKQLMQAIESDMNRQGA